MQSVSSRIWTRVAVFISYDDNNYTTVTSTNGILMNDKWHQHVSEVVLKNKNVKILWDHTIQTDRCHCRSDVMLARKGIWYGFFVKWHINFRGLFNVKAIIEEEQLWYYFIYSWEEKKVYTFPESISPKVNVILQLDFELSYLVAAVQHLSDYVPELSWRADDSFS